MTIAVFHWVNTIGSSCPNRYRWARSWARNKTNYSRRTLTWLLIGFVWSIWVVDWQIGGGTHASVWGCEGWDDGLHLGWAYVIELGTRRDLELVAWCSVWRVRNYYRADPLWRKQNSLGRVGWIGWRPGKVKSPLMRELILRGDLVSW